MKKLLLIIVGCLFLFGCKTSTKFVEVEKTRIDTTYIVRQKTDSIYIHDSVSTAKFGDTIMIEKWHTSFVDRLRIDTLQKITIDTMIVPQPYEVEKIKEVEKPLTSWQRIRLTIADFFIGCLSIATIAGIICFILKLK